MASSTRTGTSRIDRRWILRGLAAALLLAWIATAVWQINKPLPAGLHLQARPAAVDAAGVRFLADVTASDAFGRPVISQQIFDATLELIADAHDLLVLDYFLFNSKHGPAVDAAGDPRLLPVSRRLCDALLERRRADPKLPMLVLIDPINRAYGAQLPPELAALQAAGIDVVTTDLDGLRDPNALYSAAWRILFKWWLTPGATGSMPNLLEGGGPSVSMGAYLRLLNFKANHRKLIITGNGHGSLRGIVTSANPHDASSAHSNIGLQFEGAALLPLLQSELAIARFSGWRGELPRLPLPATPAVATGLEPATTVQVVTEGAIRDALLARLNATQRADRVDIAMFYLTDRPIVRALLAAARRGVSLRVILDPNKDAFGYEKSGLPNRQVATELVSASDGAIRVRWYRTHGEQFHSKFVAITHADSTWILLGSANLTRRNIGDYNLEADVIVAGSRKAEPAISASAWFEKLWSNRAIGGIEYTSDVDVYADPSQGRYCSTASWKRPACLLSRRCARFRGECRSTEARGLINHAGRSLVRGLLKRQDHAAQAIGLRRSTASHIEARDLPVFAST
jgi:hypothetical protein